MKLIAKTIRMDGIITGLVLWVFSYTLSLTLLMMVTVALSDWFNLGLFSIQEVSWEGDFWGFLEDFFNMRQKNE